MSDMPSSQNQNITAILLKAYEHKELGKYTNIQLYTYIYTFQIEKLKRINTDNLKILGKLNRITDGKELKVGHH